MGDNKTFRVNVQTSTSKKINVTSNVSENYITASPDTGLYYSRLSEKWAIGEGLVENKDYSSKTYATQAKEYANESKMYSESANLDLNNLNNAITQYDEQITNTVATGLAEITTLQESSLSEIETLRTNAVEDITTNKTNALFDITSAENNALANIETDLNNATSEINTNRTNTLAQISTLANTSISDINAVGNSYDNITHKNITNCLLEVPQRIKLELVDGAVILKAGSEVIVPNGANVFDYIKIESDLSFNYSGTGTTDIFLLYNFTSNTLGYALASTSVSGTTAPTDSRLYYNTANNIIDYYNNGKPNNIKYAFPIAILSRSGGTVTGIKQVFNGMGYIGSTVWVDKGVKGLAPDGRNEDGTLRNKERIITKVFVLDTYNRSDTDILYISDELHLSPFNCRYFYVDKYPTPASNTWYLVYSTSENMFYKSDNGNDYVKTSRCFVGEINSVYQGNITSFNPKQPFRAVDYNDALLNSDKNIISGWGMPSNKYVNLTLGASGSQYAAPANGWFYIQKEATGNQFVLMANDSKGPFATGLNMTNGNTCYLYLPCQKGDVISVHYNAAGNTPAFIFRYAEGEM